MVKYNLLNNNQDKIEFHATGVTTLTNITVTPLVALLLPILLSRH